MKYLVFIAMIGIANIGYTQARYKIKDSDNVAIKLSGTSTLHDWVMDGKSATGEAQFDLKTGSKSELVSVLSLTFSLKVKELKSDNKSMDKNAYKALKSDDYEEIRYTLTSAELSPDNGGYLLKSTGKLTIAGITKNIVMNVRSVVNSNGTITCKGSYELDMTDYNVAPPSFAFGAMKTGAVVTLDFEVTYRQ